MRRLAALLLLCFLVFGCSNPHVYLRIRNVGQTPVRDVELNYGVMFGIGELKPGEARERYVKFAEPQDLSVRFYDASNRLHTSKGPRVEAKAAGSIEVQLGNGGWVGWVVVHK